jgi:hypothetical protein
LEGRVGVVIDHGTATLSDYNIVFNKLSIDKSGKTNIAPEEQQNVFGVLYEMSDEQLKMLDESEKGYVRVPMIVDVGGKPTEVQTYVAMEERISNDLLPTSEYLSYLIDGAVEHNFPKEYQTFLRSIKVCN